jgi:K+ transporter
MTVHWWQARHQEPRWKRKLLINGVGCTFTGLILIVTTTLKFYDGGWVTIVMTGGLIAICYFVRRHYDYVHRAIEQLEADVLPEIFAAAEREPAVRDPDAPTAVLLVNGFNGLGLATLTTIPRLFDRQFHNVVFISVAEIDSNRLKGPEVVQKLEQEVSDDLLEYCRFAADLGFHPELRTGIGPDVVVELRRLCLEVAHEFPHSVFFAGKLVFTDELEGFVSRFLHNHTALEMQTWLQIHGLSLVILPVRVAPSGARVAPVRPLAPAPPAAAAHE